MSWHEVTTLEQLKSRGRILFRHGASQIAVFAVGENFYAVDNRCPHEGYPLMQGEIDPTRCTLTCQWHNWKFDLGQGEALVGQDAVRTYPVKLEGDKLWIELSPPAPGVLKSARLKALKAAFGERQYGRVARELARMHFQGLDPKDALRAAIGWAHSRLEFGMTHAHAAMADWLSLAHSRQNAQEQLIPLLEAFDHLALDVLGSGEFPYPTGSMPYDEAEWLAAIEAEDEPKAMAMLNQALNSGRPFKELLPAFTQAALAHHLDFGHSLIYVQKTAELIDHLGQTVAADLCRALLRSIIYATREDLLPDFKAYAPALGELRAQGFGTAAQTPAIDGLLGSSVKNALGWVLTQAAESAPEAIFRALLQALAHNLLHFDAAHQSAREVPVGDTVGWLDVTHGLTFANAVHTLCRQVPELWPQGLLQMALFYGRNTPYVDAGQPLEIAIDDEALFWSNIEAHLLDHGIGQPILAAHHLKTALAVRAEAAELPAGDRTLLYQALWRYLSSPAKQKHLWRTMHQSLALIGKDFPSA